MAQLTNGMSDDVLNALESKYIKFADGDTKRLRFLPEHTTTDTTDFNGRRKTPVRRFKFMTLNHDSQISLESQELREWETGIEVAKVLKTHFDSGKVDFKITRHGSDKDTTYTIVPIEV